MRVDGGCGCPSRGHRTCVGRSPGTVDNLVCEGGGSPLLHAQEALDPRVQTCVGRTQDGFTKKVPVYLCEGGGGGRERVGKEGGEVGKEGERGLGRREER